MSSSSPLWSSNFAVTVFDWASLLDQWQARSVVPLPLRTVQVNLKAATNPRSAHNPPISQFLQYMNYPEEKEGVYWMLHEIIAGRWMFDTFRMDYLRALVNRVDIDVAFPVFPGAPNSSQTVREFLHSNLSVKEYATLDLMPPLLDEYEPGYEYEAEEEAEAEEVASPAAAVSSSSVAATPEIKYPTAQILIIRDTNKPNCDDKIIVAKKGEDSYNFTYTDNMANNDKASMTCLKRQINSREVITSLRYILNFLVIDNEPFQSIQVLLPGLPSIMLNTNNVTPANRDTIYDAMEMTMRNWPLKV
jgi:hypothetical protein